MPRYVVMLDKDLNDPTWKNFWPVRAVRKSAAAICAVDQVDAVVEAVPRKLANKTELCRHTYRDTADGSNARGAGYALNPK